MPPKDYYSKSLSFVDGMVSPDDLPDCIGNCFTLYLNVMDSRGNIKASSLVNYRLTDLVWDREGLVLILQQGLCQPTLVCWGDVVSMMPMER